MSTSKEYNNEMDAPIHDDYIVEQARVNKEPENITESTTEAKEMSQRTSRKKRLSIYDEDICFPYMFENGWEECGVDDSEESPPPASSANTLPEFSISKLKAIVEKNNIWSLKF